MKIELTAKQPLLEVASKETAIMLIEIEKEQTAANETQKIVSAEEIIATKQAAEA